MARKCTAKPSTRIARAPESAVIWNKIGIAYHQLLQLNLAKKNYEHALKLDPKYSEAINNLGPSTTRKRSMDRPSSAIAGR